MEHTARDVAVRPETTLRRVTPARWRPLTEGAALILPLVAGGMAAMRFFRPAAPFVFLAAAGVAMAFRDPERRALRRPGAAVAPADGRVIHVERIWDEYWETELVEIAIFLSLWDVHIQRTPLDGEVVAQQRRSGGYRPAMTRAATHGNNQLATYLQTAAGPCTVTQISGIAARRIVNWTSPGGRLKQGERLGMIKFGSQVTVRLPLGANVLVEPGDRVRAGVTPIAEVVPAIAEAASSR